MIKIKYGYRDHRGSLKDSLETIKYITCNEFKKLLNEYEYYTFDKRCNQILFIRKNLGKSNPEDPTWLFIEISA